MPPALLDKSKMQPIMKIAIIKEEFFDDPEGQSDLSALCSNVLWDLTSAVWR